MKMAIITKDFQKQILNFIQAHPLSSSKEIHEGLAASVGYATVKRNLQKLCVEHLILTHGAGKATKYVISPSYELLIPIDPEEYFQQEIDERNIKINFSHDLLSNQLMHGTLFTDPELNELNSLQQTFSENIRNLSDTEFKAEFERLAIDLSWKSSQIEGNTYSLLETERLIRDKEAATGKTKEEANMLLNHKAALDFLIDHPDYVQPLTISGIEDIHSILMKDLQVPRNLRNSRVGISGTNYKPLDNSYKIREALDEMCVLVNAKHEVFEKAFIVMLIISYIQPFVDGNKRTARIISNAILMNHHYCPISFRTVSAIDYKKAMLIFYEQNNISAFKKIFIEQFKFAVNTYF